MSNTKRTLRAAYATSGAFLGHYETGVASAQGQKRLFENKADMFSTVEKGFTKLVKWKEKNDA